ncbi:hypothetical protein Thermus77420_24400 [Thermus thalpophilus]
MYVALGVTPDGARRVLGFWLLPTENALAWEGVLRELWERGLRRVLLFLTDGLPGIEEAIRRVYPLAEWQRCVVHQVRGSLSQVRSRDRAALAQDLRGVYMAESRREALGALERLREVWGGKYPALVAAWWKGALAVLAEHQPHGAVDSGDEAGDEGAGPQVSSAGGGVQAFVLGGRLDRYTPLEVDPTP